MNTAKLDVACFMVVKDGLQKGHHHFSGMLHLCFRLINEVSTLSRQLLDQALGLEARTLGPGPNEIQQESQI